MTGRGGGCCEGGRSDAVSYRPGCEDDVLPSASVFKRALNGHYGRYNLPLVMGPDEAFVPLHRHILNNAGPRFWVAEDDGGMLGFGAGIVRGELWYLAALFVVPEAQGRGVGRELLRLARTGVSSGLAATITDALQPVSNTLYARHGMLPSFPVLGLEGEPSRAQPPRLPRGCELIPLEPAMLDEVRRIDREVTGLDRTPEHLFYLSEDGGRDGWIMRRHGHPAGYVYARPTGLIGPAASRRSADMGVLMRSALWTMNERGVDRVHVPVPGPNRVAQQVLLEARFVFEACPGMFLASRPFGRFDRYVIANYGLM